MKRFELRSALAQMGFDYADSDLTDLLLKLGYSVSDGCEYSVQVIDQVVAALKDQGIQPDQTQYTPTQPRPQADYSSTDIARRDAYEPNMTPAAEFMSNVLAHVGNDAALTLTTLDQLMQQQVVEPAAQEMAAIVLAAPEQIANRAAQIITEGLPKQNTLLMEVAARTLGSFRAPTTRKYQVPRFQLPQAEPLRLLGSDADH